MKGGYYMSCGIYKITNKINQKCYIGCSKNIEKRWNSHKSESVLEQFPQYNYSIHKAFRKYGLDNFSFEIIEEISENKLFDREKYWITFYNSYNDGYNATIGGDGGSTKEIDKEVFISLYEQHFSPQELAEYFNCCTDTISAYAKKFGISFKG